MFFYFVGVCPTLADPLNGKVFSQGKLAYFCVLVVPESEEILF